MAVGSSVATVVAAGDITRNGTDARGTAALVKKIGPDVVLALGDTAYEDGTPEEYRQNYQPTWGAFKAITRPIAGNHEYGTPGAAGFFAYFRNQVHGLPYYAFDAGPWRLYALSCEVDCGRDSAQVRWLARDLAAHAGRPALGYIHEPLFTCSTHHPPTQRVDDVWRTLREAGGQAMLSGNNHAYERFARLDENGQPTPDGLRQFVVGTGGVALYPLEPGCSSREAQTDTAFGVLKLELRPDSFGWQFIDVDGTVLDEGEDQIS